MVVTRLLLKRRPEPLHHCAALGGAASRGGGPGAAGPSPPWAAVPGAGYPATLARLPPPRTGLPRRPQPEEAPPARERVGAPRSRSIPGPGRAGIIPFPPSSGATGAGKRSQTLARAATVPALMYEQGNWVPFWQEPTCALSLLWLRRDGEGSGGGKGGCFPGAPARAGPPRVGRWQGAVSASGVSLPSATLAVLSLQGFFLCGGPGSQHHL